MKQWNVWPLALVVLAACDDIAGLGIDCNFDENFSEVIAVSGADRLDVLADAGDLEIRGRSGLNEIRVRGTACAEDLDDIDDIDVVVQRSGSTVRVFGLVPSGAVLDARLDLIIEVPDWMLVDIQHDAGDIEVNNVSGVAIRDDGGNIRVENIFGDVDINDDSGTIWIRDVDGDVFLLDESGDIDARLIGGSVLIEEDASGNITLENVDQDVVIVEDGSGDIVVDDVGGDFTVEFDSSGNIVFRNVRGIVSVPN